MITRSLRRTIKNPATPLRNASRVSRRKTVPADHFLVADGFAQDWIDTCAVRHFKLDTGHADFGNTPRGIGALLAASEQYRGIGFLDADCWLDANHIELCRRAAGNDPIDFVVANRRMGAPDGTVLAVAEEPDHVDTNCLSLFEGAFHTLHHWVLQPRAMAPLDDRIIWHMLKDQGLNWQRTEAITVNYLFLWRNLYTILGLAPPAGATPPSTTRFRRILRVWMRADSSYCGAGPASHSNPRSEWACQAGSSRVSRAPHRAHSVSSAAPARYQPTVCTP